MKKEIELKYFLIAIALLMLLEGILVCTFLKKNKAINTSMCASAVCNEDNSLCYVYDLDKEGHTIIKWKGSCQK